MSRLKRAIEISRPFLWPAPIIIFLFAVIYSGNTIGLKEIVYAFLWSFPNTLWFCSLNDLSDFETDKYNKTKGGISGAKVSINERNFLKKLATSSGGILLLSVFFIPSVLYILCGIMGIILGYIYSFKPIRLKERPFFDSLSNGIALALIFLCGYFFHGYIPLSMVAIQSVTGLIIATSALHIIIAIRDIGPDTKSGMKTVATVLGAKQGSIVVACLFFILFFVLSGFPLLLRIFPVIGIIGAIYLYEKPDARRAIKVGIGLIGLFVVFAVVQLFFYIL